MLGDFHTTFMNLLISFVSFQQNFSHLHMRKSDIHYCVFELCCIGLWHIMTKFWQQVTWSFTKMMKWHNKSFCHTFRSSNHIFCKYKAISFKPNRKKRLYPIFKENIKFKHFEKSSLYNVCDLPENLL